MSKWFERTIRRTPEPLPADASRESLLAAVLAAPDDDRPRWVMSDWLLGAGDPRGEFIAVQLTLAGLDEDDRHRAELAAREAELLEQHKVDWVGRFKGARIEYGVVGGKHWARGNPTRWTFARGFVDEVSMALLDFIANAEVLLAEEPVRVVHLTQATRLLPRLVDECPRLEQVRGLDLSRAKLGDEDLGALLSCPRFAALERLSLSQCRIGSRRGKRALTGASPSMPRLRVLVLTDNNLGDAGVTALASCPILAPVTELVLTSNKLGAKGAAALIDSAYLDNLEQLWLGSPSLPKPTMQALRRRFGSALQG